MPGAKGTGCWLVGKEDRCLPLSMHSTSAFRCSGHAQHLHKQAQHLSVQAVELMLIPHRTFAIRSLLSSGGIAVGANHMHFTSAAARCLCLHDNMRLLALYITCVACSKQGHLT